VARSATAGRIGIRTQVLDGLVKKKRRELGLETAGDDVGQGRAVKIEDILPWPDDIEGDHVASALAASLKRYVVLPDAAAAALALWVLHTWLVDRFTISPRLAVTSPTKGCGKTTALRFLNQVVRRPKRAGSISPPALFRVVEQFHPTIILDETEKYIEHGSDLHALLNEGHCTGGTVLRVLGDKLELREFSVFGAVAFAANGRLADDLEQRSIVIELQRRRADESVSELREDRCEHLTNLARMCARWADDVGGDVAGHDPDMAGLINRDADNWRPLFAIADLVGSDWPSRAREAAFALTPKHSESIGPMLLGDIKAVFDDRSVDRLSSAEICTALCGMEGKPWADWKGKSLTANQLARLLKSFGITSDSVRIGDRTPEGVLPSPVRGDLATVPRARAGSGGVRSATPQQYR
jgi:putative DNA primase/helicase